MDLWEMEGLLHLSFYLLVWVCLLPCFIPCFIPLMRLFSAVVMLHFYLFKEMLLLLYFSTYDPFSYPWGHRKEPKLQPCFDFYNIDLDEEIPDDGDIGKSPSLKEKEQHSRIKKLKEEKTCCICMVNCVRLKSKVCCHTFCVKCTKMILMSEPNQRRCPLCRIEWGANRAGFTLIYDTYHKKIA